MIVTALSWLFASMTAQKRPSVILGGEGIVEVFSDALSEILNDEHGSSQSNSVIVDEGFRAKYT